MSVHGAMQPAPPRWRQRLSAIMQVFPMDGIGFFSLINRSVQAYVRHDMAVHAAALAYRILFSMFPFIIFVIALLGFFQLPEFFGWLKQQARPFLPPPAMAQVDAILLELQVPKSGLLSTGAATALWLASSGVRSMMKALNVVYSARESRPLWKRFPLSVLYTLGIALMLIAAATLMNLGPTAMQWLARQTGLETAFVTLWAWLRRRDRLPLHAQREAPVSANFCRICAVGHGLERGLARL
jgi:membrane protein